MNLIGANIVLRALEIQDMEVMRDIINDTEVESLVIGWSFPVSSRQQTLWYERIINDKRSLRFAIDTKEDGLIGMADLRDIDWKNGVASHGIKIGNINHRGKGYGKDVVFTIMKYAFEELNLHRLETTIGDYNGASKKLYLEKCGWKLEGTQRENLFKGNKYHNQLIVGILREEYIKLINNKDCKDDLEK